MRLNQKIVDEINKCGFENIDLKVVIHKNKIFRDPLQKNNEMGIYLEVSNDKISDTYVKCKIISIPRSVNNALEGISDNYFCEEAKIPALANTPGGKYMFNKMRMENLHIIRDLWIHPNLRKEDVLEEISEMINAVLVEEDDEHKNYLLLIPEKNDDEHKLLYLQLGYCMIHNTDVFIYTDWECCEKLVMAAIKINAVQTSNNKILVYKTYGDKTKDGYEEVALVDFVDSVYREPEGQYHILNAVFNNP